MKVFTNPISNEEFDTKEELVESLSEEYCKVKAALFSATNREKQVLTLLDELAGMPEITKGKVTLQGKTVAVTLTRKENVSYPKDRGGEHPLRAILGQFPELGSMIRVSYAESGSKIAKLLEEEPESPLAQIISEARKTTSGKLGVQIQDSISL